MERAEQQMQQLKKYLDKQKIAWKPTEAWSLLFSGNHPEGIYIAEKEAPFPYLKKLTELTWEYRGHYTTAVNLRQNSFSSDMKSFVPRSFM